MMRWFLENGLVAGAAAGLVLITCRWLRFRPAVCHLLWLGVMLLLVIPPVNIPGVPSIKWRTGVAGLGSHIEGWVRGSESGQPTPPPVFQSLSREDRMRAEERMARTTNPGQRPMPLAEQHRPDGRTSVSMRNATEETNPFTPFVFVVWLLGAVVLAFRHGTRIARFHRRIRRAHVPPRELVALVTDVARALRVRPPTIRCFRGSLSPFVWGVGRPVLLWPNGLLSDLDQAGMRGIVAHELNHLRRRDHWVAWVELTVMIVCWWNPVFWLARRELRHYSEMACDASVVNTLPKMRRSYAEALIDIAERLAPRALSAPALGAWDVNRSSFERRLSLIMSKKTSHRVPPALTAVLLVAAAIVLPSPGQASEGAQETPVLVSTVLHPASYKIERRRAHHLFKEKNLDDALRAYEAILAKDPNDGSSHHMVSLIKLFQGKPKESIPALEHQLRVGFRKDLAQYNLACAHSLTGNKQTALEHLHLAVKEGFLDRSHTEEDADLENIRELDGFAAALESMSALTELKERADIAWHKGAPHEAGELYARLLEKTAGDGETLHRFGYAMITKGEVSAAQTAFTRQVELEWRRPIGLYNLACAASRLGNADQAMLRLTEAMDAGFDDVELLKKDTDLTSVREDPRLFKLIHRHASIAKTTEEIQAAFKANEWCKAKDLCQALLAASPRHDEARLWLGQSCLQLGELQTAKEAFAQQLERETWMSTSLYNLGLIAFRTEDTARALAYLEDAAMLGYDRPDMLQQFGKLAQDSRFMKVVSVVKANAEATEAKAKEYKKEKAYGDKKERKEKETDESKQSGTVQR